MNYAPWRAAALFLTISALAAAPAFDLYDVPGNLLWYWRHGYHYHEISDVELLANLICHKKYGDELDDRFFDLPFDPEILSGD